VTGTGSGGGKREKRDGNRAHYFSQKEEKLELRPTARKGGRGRGTFIKEKGEGASKGHHSIHPGAGLLLPTRWMGRKEQTFIRRQVHLVKQGEGRRRSPRFRGKVRHEEKKKLARDAHPSRTRGKRKAGKKKGASSSLPCYSTEKTRFNRKGEKRC